LSVSGIIGPSGHRRNPMFAIEVIAESSPGRGQSRGKFCGCSRRPRGNP
jgi:hypothetical protein